MLLTGATGFLGRYLALEWLERMDLVDGKVICLVRAKDDARRPRSARRDLRQRRPGTAARTTGELAADHLEVIAGDKGEANLGLDPADLAAAGRHRRPDRRPRRAGQPRAALQPAVRAQRARHRRADPDRAHHQDSSRSSTCRRSASAPASSRRRSPRTPTSGSISATRTVDDSYANGYAQQQVGRRGAAARGPRPVRSAGRGVPLRHDPGRHHLRGSAQRAGHVHPADAEPGRHRHRARLVLRARRRRATGNGRTTTGCQSNSSPRRSRRWARGVVDGFETYHVMNPYDDGIGLDEFVDWLIDAGYPIAARR